jgi:holo-[acyl-carrier protein] synthase
MAIFGAGVDISHIPRFVRLVQRWGPRFLRRAFAPREILHIEKIMNGQSSPSLAAATFIASRWSAKEALHKAIAPRGGIRLDFREIEVSRHSATTHHTLVGAPSFVFHGAAAAALTRLQIAHPVLSLSHDGEYAIAFVVVTAPEASASPTLAP